MKKLYCIIPILILFLFAIADLPSSQISAQSACLTSCSSCTTTTTCTNTTYDTCDTSPCTAAGATSTTLFSCYASSNSSCSGSYQCASCASTSPPPPPTCSGTLCGGVCYGPCPSGYPVYSCDSGTPHCCPSGTSFCSVTSQCVDTSYDCNTGTVCGGSYYYCQTGYQVQCSTLTCIAPTPTPTPTPTPAPTLPPQVPTGEAATTYTIATGYSGTQGPIWYYYYKEGTANPTTAVYEPGPWIWYDVPAGNPYWNGPGDDWMMLTPGYSAGDGSKIAILYWKAPQQGIASMTVTDKKVDFLAGGAAKGNGYKFGVGYAASLGSWSPDPNEIITGGGDATQKTKTITQPMRGGGYLFYYKDSMESVEGDGAQYTVTITLTPTQDATTTTPPPTPTPTPTHTPTPSGPQGIGACGTGTARASGLVSTPELTNTFPTSSGACIIDPKAAFAPFKIPTYADLKSLYYDQK